MTLGVAHRGAQLTIYYGHSALDTYLVTGLPKAPR